MSHTHPTAVSSLNFQLIFNNALKAYEKRTKSDLVAHPLAAQFQACNSPSAILAVLHQQVQELNQSKTTDERWTRWLDPTVNILYSLSATLGEGVGLVFSPGKVIFAGIGLLLVAAKDARASQDILIDILERVENFIRRLEMYTVVPSTTVMMDIVMKIMVEVLCILAIATEEIKQSRMKKYMSKLLGKTDLEDSLKRLDKLTHEEARMAIAQNLKATHTVDERVRGLEARVVGVDDRVAGVEDRLTNRVAGVDSRVKGVDDKAAGIDRRVMIVDDKVTAIVAGAKEGRVINQQIANDVDQVKRNQLRESVHRWLSPSDPSTNHNIACSTHHKRGASWFFQGDIFREWTSTGSLLWIHGKPGSGKSVLSSSIIQDIEAICEAGKASMVYFYFDFRDANKQHLNDLIPSLITQLSAHSDARSDVLSRLYLAHDSGRRQPSDTVLVQCLKEMLALPDRLSVYIILDALDESPCSSGIPTPREQVLQLVKDLVGLGLPNLHVCVTSRPEADIRHVIEPLTPLRVCLHEQSGQKKDIAEYVRSVVYSDLEPIMRRWRTEDKELVIKTLAERASGMYRWVFCQLETLRHCLPSTVRRTLDELPESLDGTYERILKEIKRPNREYARRLLQCLVVAIRPLRVKELAEILAVDFDCGEGIPKLKPDWRWDDHEQALLSSCSSLITAVDVDKDGGDNHDDDKDNDSDNHSDNNSDINSSFFGDIDIDNDNADDSRVVQFSHFSVKEFLTSPRLATSSGDISHYHIDLEPANTVLSQACLGILLQMGDRVDKTDISDGSPLARYAAQYWVDHARFENVSTQVRTAMEYLFDPDRPHFFAWLRLYDIDTAPPLASTFYLSKPINKSAATPLYYAALCGFHDLVNRLIVRHPQYVNADGGYYMRPLVAALAGQHFQTAEVIRRHGADPNVQRHDKKTPLHSALYYGTDEVIQKLIEYGADPHAEDQDGETPLSVALFLERHNALRFFLEHGVDGNTRMKGSTLLHIASRDGNPKLVRLLLEHGASVGVEDDEGRTPLLVASNSAVTGLLLEYGAT